MDAQTDLDNIAINTRKLLSRVPHTAAELNITDASGGGGGLSQAQVDARVALGITGLVTTSQLDSAIAANPGPTGPQGPSGPTAYTIAVKALTSSPVDAQTIYFGTLPKAPITTANVSKVYIRAAGTIKRAEIYCYSGTAGTGEAWSLYIRKNNTTDTLIATVSAAASERVFTNAALNIAVASGDYIEIKAVNPTWATNPATCIFGGYIYIENA